MSNLLARWKNLSVSEKWIWFIGSAISLIVTFILVWIALSLDPAPPRSITLASGSQGGAYDAAGRRLASFLESEGVTVEVIETAGSAENINRLMAGSADVAIVQGGVGAELVAMGRLQSLGALFYEPLWIFASAETPVSDIRELDGMRIAAGDIGSGTRVLLSTLFELNGVENAIWVEEAGSDAAAALRTGNADIAAFMTSPDPAYIRDLVADPGIIVMQIERGPAYVRLLPYLSIVTLHEGVLDPAADIPAQDILLVAAAAAAVVQEGLHPAIQSLLLQAMHTDFRDGTVLSAPADFPNRDLVTFDLSDEAARYYDRGGPAFLQRYLPFWAANLVDRIWILAIPVLTLLFPLFKSAPPVYLWQIHRRIKRSYRDLRVIEQSLFDKSETPDHSALLARIATLKSDVRAMKVPWTFFDEVYVLQTHIAYVEQLMQDHAKQERDNS
jgi:TRAP transporter TAXI family solute receptor